MLFPLELKPFCSVPLPIRVMHQLPLPHSSCFCPSFCGSLVGQQLLTAPLTPCPLRELAVLGSLYSWMWLLVRRVDTRMCHP